MDKKIIWETSLHKLVIGSIFDLKISPERKLLLYHLNYIWYIEFTCEFLATILISFFDQTLLRKHGDNIIIFWSVLLCDIYGSYNIFSIVHLSNLIKVGFMYDQSR